MHTNLPAGPRASGEDTDPCMDKLGACIERALARLLLNADDVADEGVVLVPPVVTRGLLVLVPVNSPLLSEIVRTEKSNQRK